MKTIVYYFRLCINVCMLLLTGYYLYNYKTLLMFDIWPLPTLVTLLLFLSAAIELQNLKKP